MAQEKGENIQKRHFKITEYENCEKKTKHGRAANYNMKDDKNNAN